MSAIKIIRDNENQREITVILKDEMGVNKLNLYQQKAVIELYTKTKHNCVTIAKRYNVDPATICKILQRGIDGHRYSLYKRVKNSEAQRRRFM